MATDLGATELAGAGVLLERLQVWVDVLKMLDENARLKWVGRGAAAAAQRGRRPQSNALRSEVLDWHYSTVADRLFGRMGQRWSTGDPNAWLLLKWECRRPADHCGDGLADDLVSTQYNRSKNGGGLRGSNPALKKSGGGHGRR